MNGVEARRLKIVSIVREADGTLTVEIQTADGNTSRLAGCHILPESMQADVGDHMVPVRPMRN